MTDVSGLTLHQKSHFSCVILHLSDSTLRISTLCTVLNIYFSLCRTICSNFEGMAIDLRNQFWPGCFAYFGFCVALSWYHCSLGWWQQRFLLVPRPFSIFQEPRYNGAKDLFLEHWADEFATIDVNYQLKLISWINVIILYVSSAQWAKISTQIP